MEITDQQLLDVIEKSPLISIDLIVRDFEGKILLGRRINEPAKGMWFVPGGRIRKNENLDDAFARISSFEIGIKYHRSQARFIGVFEHKYNTNFLGTADIGTHYIVLAYELRPTILPNKLPITQHNEFGWFGQDTAKTNPQVHRHVLPYYTESISDGAFESQYTALNNRRDSFNSLLWQTPVLSLTAQAFLFTIALSKDVTNTGRAIAASLALVVAMASIQLMIKHRFNEVYHRKLLARLENERGLIPINVRHVPTIKWNPETWLAKPPSYWLWVAMLLGFGICALLIIIKPHWFK